MYLQRSSFLSSENHPEDSKDQRHPLKPLTAFSFLYSMLIHCSQKNEFPHQTTM